MGRRKKLIGFLSLLLGRCRKGKYDLVGAANGGGGQVQWDTGKSYNVFALSSGFWVVCLPPSQSIHTLIFP